MGTRTAGVDDGSLIGGRTGGSRRATGVLLAAAVLAAGLVLASLAALSVRSRDRLQEATIATPSPGPWPPPPGPMGAALPRRVADGVTRIESPDGRLVVTYKVQDDPSTTQGMTLNGVTMIEFHSGYITVAQGGGGGEVFFADRTLDFRWSWGEPTAR